MTANEERLRQLLRTARPRPGLNTTNLLLAFIAAELMAFIAMLLDVLYRITV